MLFRSPSDALFAQFVAELPRLRILTLVDLPDSPALTTGGADGQAIATTASASTANRNARPARLAAPPSGIDPLSGEAMKRPCVYSDTMQAESALSNLYGR